QVLSDVLKRKEIYNYFSRPAMEKGHAYQAQGRVSAVGVSDDLTRVSSQVQGSGSRNYRVNIQLEFDRDRLTDIEGDCSCPMAFNCKHVAATLLEALSDKQPSKNLAPKNLALMPAPLTAKPAKTQA